MQQSAIELERLERGFNSTRFRGAMSSFCTGVTIITTRGPDEPYGMTASSFTSVSLDPPLILVCVIRGTLGSETISRNGAFAVNILSSTQEPLSRYFAARDRPRGEHAFREVAHRDGVTGSPILDRVAGHLECQVVQSYEVGDHIVFIGEVLDLDFDGDVKPLLFHHGRYRLLHEDG
jgi:flavin reductase (DIM6/NTAB) family NADH-FMN oxidoreductase RutF